MSVTLSSGSQFHQRKGYGKPCKRARCVIRYNQQGFKMAVSRRHYRHGRWQNENRGNSRNKQGSLGAGFASVGVTRRADCIYTDVLLDGQTESGVNALSAYTMINGDDKHCYAMPKETLKSLDITYNKTFGENEIQIWRYAPKLLSRTGTADRLSLYLSLKENDDERVQIELERLINEMQWKKE